MTTSGKRGVAIGLAVLAVLAVGSWLHDDAYITLRTVSNLLDGHGMRWNVAERVQTFTHPLWLFVLTATSAITGSFFWGAIVPGLLLSAATLLIVVGRARGGLADGAIAVFLLLASKAYYDYASSGLEDPLTRLLVLSAILYSAGRAGEGAQLVPLTALASLATLCRPEAPLLFLPTLVGAWRSRSSRLAWPRLLLAVLPVVLWAGFALSYFGSPFPNTAFAKLGSGVPRVGLLLQGILYLGDSLSRDPLTLVTLVLCSVFAWRSGDSAARRWLAGAWLYLAYVVWIGGDYMSGRFLGLPLLMTVGACFCLGAPSSRQRRALGTALVVCLLARLVTAGLQPQVNSVGIGDERRIYSPFSGLLNGAVAQLAVDRDLRSEWPTHPWRFQGEELRRARTPVTVFPFVGMLGFFAGAEVHVVDPMGLTDGLLARLPGRVCATFNWPGSEAWRPGHFERSLPDGYLALLESGRGQLSDVDLERARARIELITRAELYSGERLRAILEQLGGASRREISSYVRRHPEVVCDERARAGTVGAMLKRASSKDRVSEGS